MSESYIHIPRDDNSIKIPSFDAVIPAFVRYDSKLSNNAKLLYGEIRALTNAYGFCWASNEYFAALYDVDVRTIKRWLQNLEEAGHIIQTKERDDQTLKIVRIIRLQFPSQEPSREKMDKNVQKNGQKCPKKMDKNVHSNNTSNINNNYTNSFNNSILSNHEVYEQPDQDEIDAIDELNEVAVDVIKHQVGYEALMHDYDNNPLIDAIVELMVETITSTTRTIRIAGENKSPKDVARRFTKIDMDVMKYVLDSLEICDSDIRDIKSYLLTTLYNAPVTIGAYYLTKVNSDKRKSYEERAGDSS